MNVAKLSDNVLTFARYFPIMGVKKSPGGILAERSEAMTKGDDGSNGRSKSLMKATMPDGSTHG